MEQQLLILAVSAIFSYVAVKLCIRLAHRFAFVDHPNARKHQKQPLPMLGGVGMMVTFALMLSVLRLTGDVSNPVFLSIIIGLAVLLVAGFLDDFAKTKQKDFPALPKLVLQIGAAAIATYGIRIHGVRVPIGHTDYISFSPILGSIVTVVWIVGIINAFNFIDGLDGLAGGIAAIAASSLMLVSIIMHETSASMLAAAVAGTALGYVRHNFYPARVIMGDTGSMFLGFVLACISVVGAVKGVAVVSVSVPVLALGVPVFDGVYVVIRRLISGKPIYNPDRSHVHFRLMDSGFMPKQVVLVLYTASACFGLCSCILAITKA
jgi:UDP-GlcNAc:undecaprenyl-phosphate/decaprenyl-phosphate GlcNAc-1-phosphate transferase